MSLSPAESLATTDRERQLLEARARELVRRLRGLSQEAVAARWLTGLEFMVWQDIRYRRLVAGLPVSPEGDVFPPLDDDEKEELRCLSESIGGWVAYDSQDAEDRAAFVPFAAWLARFETWLDRARPEVARCAQKQGLDGA